MKRVICYTGVVIVVQKSFELMKHDVIIRTYFRVNEAQRNYVDSKPTTNPSELQCTLEFQYRGNSEASESSGVFGSLKVVGPILGIQRAKRIRVHRVTRTLRVLRCREDHSAIRILMPLGL